MIDPLDKLWRDIIALDRELAAVADEVDTEAADIVEAATEAAIAEEATNDIR